MIKGFHIEPTNICTLKCEGCARTRFIQQWPQHWKNQSVNIDSLMKFIDIDIAGMQVNFCGNYGDPIYHPEFPQMIQQFKQRGAVVSIVTNGSYRTLDWWQKLVSLLDHKDRITFSIDGVPDNFTQYRINADWASIKQGIEICAAAPVITEWKYIPFEFNQHTIDQARGLSTSLNMDFFTESPSDRFDQQTQHLIPVATLIGKRFESQQQWKQTHANEISAKCNNGREHFISATGHYIPCCYVGDHRFYYKNTFGKNKKQYEITTTTISELLSQPSVVEFYADRAAQSACQYNCPKI